MKKEDLNNISKDIYNELSRIREEMKLTFIENKHQYFMKDLNGVVRNDYPSVSSIYKLFYEEFDSDAVSLAMAKGDKDAQQELLKKWRLSGKKSQSLGSRTHYFLEEHLVEMYKSYKDLRYPIFSCDKEDTENSDNMIKAGKDYIDLMHERGAVLLDTEIIVGDPELGYTGQPDNAWLMLNKKKELGIIISDWKTNQVKNFIIQRYNNDYMYKPFDKYINYALNHYFIQIPLYGRLLLKMLQKSDKFKDIKFFGGVIIHLLENGKYKEYRVPQDIINKTMNLNIQEYIII